MKALALITFTQFLLGCHAENAPTPTCSIKEDVKDPNLKEMSFDIGFGTEYFEAFMEPDIATMTQGKHDKVTPPRFEGHAAKFFNMSPNPVKYYWVNDANEPLFMGTCKPFHSVGTASFPRHRFFFGPEDYETSKVVLQHFTIDGNGKTNHYYYDPITVENDKAQTDKNLSMLTLPQLEKYNKMLRNKKFGEEYLKFTGREYMTMYPRPKPKHYMWPADYLGQVHWITTKETEFTSLPPKKKLKRIKQIGRDRVLAEDEPRHFSEYRVQEEYKNMTLKVLSVRPRAYEIENFLSEVEVDYIVEYAKNANMKLSTVGQGTDNSKTRVRTSYNTWVNRDTDHVFDTVYRRAADLLRIDEALFRKRDKTEFPEWPNDTSIGEDLQLVHYNHNQEYTAHHDFGYAAVDNPLQPARFATLLLYLNNPIRGGETEFPRWVNAEGGKGLYAKPVKGKAVLFYNFLPDGNLDDLSQHAAKPVLEGEKYLINLWVRDPIKDF